MIQDAPRRSAACAASSTWWRRPASLGIFAAQELDQLLELGGDRARHFVERGAVATDGPFHDDAVERDLGEVWPGIAVEAHDQRSEERRVGNGSGLRERSVPTLHRQAR